MKVVHSVVIRSNLLHCRNILTFYYTSCLYILFILICSWQFSSLHIDENYEPPLRVNQQGDYSCINATVCVHQVDYDHYTR